MKKNSLITKKSKYENVKSINKSNSLIRSKTTKKLSLMSYKLVNHLYYDLQKSYNFEKDIDFSKPLTIKLQTLREYLGISKKNKNYQQVIKDTLEELKTEIQLQNYEKDGKSFEWYKTQFIGDIGMFKSKTNKKERVFHIEIKQTLYEVIERSNKNFTPFKLEIIDGFRSVKTLRLYEYIKSFSNMSKTGYLYIDNINNILTSNYRYLSQTLRLIERNIEIINETTELKITIDYYHKEKYLVFKITNYKELKEQHKKEVEEQKSHHEINAIIDLIGKKGGSYEK